MVECLLLNHACARCSRSCPPNDCKSGALRKCVNCKGNHASTNKICPVLKEHIQGLFENQKAQTYTATLAKQQKQIREKQKSQEISIVSISTQLVNTESLQNIVEKQKEEICKQNEEISKLHKFISKQNETIAIHDQQINNTNIAIKTAMEVINQMIEINETKVTLLKHLFTQNAIHPDLHKIISECIYNNIDNRRKIKIQETTERKVKRVTKELNREPNSKIRQYEHTNINHQHPNKKYEAIIDEH